MKSLQPAHSNTPLRTVESSIGLAIAELRSPHPKAHSRGQGWPQIARLVCVVGSSARAAVRASNGRHSRSSVDRRVNLRRDGLDLRAELLLYPVQVEAVLVGHEVDAQAEVPEAPRSADAVQVRLRVLGEVKVDDDVHRLYVYAAREEVGGDQTPAGPVSEVVEDPVAVRLVHARVDEEARVVELRDLLGEELHAGHGVAEDDGLVDLQLGEEGVQAVHLLALLHEGVELRDALQRELVHEVDLVRLRHVPVLELHDGHGEGRGVHEDLPL
mmetsp:Transcript_97126/g.258092  ORF Transcript_97126/g.258092 Transcript_97126/m.258092 type:complete len:271 (-) Transcript_97126:782-1594(-)